MDDRRKVRSQRSSHFLMGRVVLALLLFVSQVAWGTAACVCPPATPTTTVQTGGMVCPVSKSKSCACCAKAGKKSGAKSQKAELTSCLSAPAPVVLSQADKPFPCDDAVAALPDAPPVARIFLLPPPDRGQSLGADRIRPPTLEGHSLRAPPAR